MCKYIYKLYILGPFELAYYRCGHKFTIRVEINVGWNK